MDTRRIVTPLACLVLVAGCGGDLGTDASDSSQAATNRSLGEDVVLAAVGLETQPARLEFTVPVSSGADILSARLRWVGRGTIETGDPTVLINGHQRAGTLVASFHVAGDLPWVTIHEYDATPLVRGGINRLFVSGFAPGGDARADGIGIIVRYRDDSAPWTAIHILDPFEHVSGNMGEVWPFPIGYSNAPRSARFLMLAGDCEASGTDRIWWTAGSGAAPPDLADAGTDSWSNRLDAGEGTWIDRIDETIAVPPAAAHFAYQLDSPADGTGDSIVHVFGALCIDGEPTECVASISGSVWLDENRDAVPDPGEPGLPDVVVRILSAGGDLLGEVTTDGVGAFAFSNLCSGDYVVAIDETSLPEGLEQTGCASGPCSPYPVSLTTDDQVASGLAFGWGPLAPAPETACFYGAGFWKHEFRILTGGNQGRPHLTSVELENLLSDAAGCTNLDWTRGDGTFGPDDAVWVLEGADGSLCARAERQYLAFLLNHAFNGLHPALPMDSDGDGVPDTTMGEVISSAEALLFSGVEADCDTAKGLLTSVEPMPSEDCPF